jgi:hypothetical protein
VLVRRINEFNNKYAKKRGPNPLLSLLADVFMKFYSDFVLTVTQT